MASGVGQIALVFSILRVFQFYNSQSTLTFLRQQGIQGGVSPDRPHPTFVRSPGAFT